MDQVERRAEFSRAPATTPGGPPSLVATPLDLARLSRDPSAPAAAGRAWGGIGLVRLDLMVGEEALPPAPHHTILVNVGRPYRLEEDLDGRRYQTSGVQGDVAIVPAGLPAAARTRERAPQRVDAFAMLLPPAFIGGVVAGGGVDPAAIELIGVLGARDPAIERIGLALLSELTDGGPMGELYVESLATALAVQLLRNHSAPGREVAAEAGRGSAGGLSKAELRRVTDHIEGCLDRGLTLAALAREAGLSPYHFARLFKSATGQTPHRYVVQRRVERARDLLANTDLPLPEVALRVGFADQSHLAKHTRRLLGVTPKALRRAGG